MEKDHRPGQRFLGLTNSHTVFKALVWLKFLHKGAATRDVASADVCMDGITLSRPQGFSLANGYGHHCFLRLL